jgi:hypothetical protein
MAYLMMCLSADMAFIETSPWVLGTARRQPVFRHCLLNGQKPLMFQPHHVGAAERRLFKCSMSFTQAGRGRIAATAMDRVREGEITEK